MKPEITGHRGASGLAPENTLAALRKAVECGADYCEIDVQETADGVVILMHDDTVNRTTNLTGNVWDMTYMELQTADAGSWFSPEYTGEPIPTLEQVIQTIRGKIKLNIELKVTEHRQKLVEKIVAIVRKNHFLTDCVITSFDKKAIQQVKLLDQFLRTGYTIDTSPDVNDYQGPIDLISINWKAVTPDIVERAHQLKKEVHVWTVNDESTMRRMIQWKVDNIMTNYPNVLRTVRNGMAPLEADG